MTTNTLIEGRDLRKTYRMGSKLDVRALRGVDIHIREGEMVAIMGPSGSGKSTLMHILGLLHAPDLNHGPRPDLRFEDRDMLRLGESERTRLRARRMGFVFQDFNLVPTLTAAENVMLACDYAGIRGSSARKAALEALDTLHRDLIEMEVMEDPAESAAIEPVQERTASLRGLVG